jgi:hypothetical protein
MTCLISTHLIYVSVVISNVDALIVERNERFVNHESRFFGFNYHIKRTHVLLEIVPMPIIRVR